MLQYFSEDITGNGNCAREVLGGMAEWDGTEGGGGGGGGVGD